jgi:hypothetical protein
MAKDDTSNNSSPDSGDEDIHHLSTLKLFRKIEEEAKFLVKKEIDLAKAEFKADIRSESLFTAGFIVGITAGSVSGILLLVTSIFALSLVLPGWAAGLIVSGVMLLISGIGFIFGWNVHVKRPLTRTREVLKADKNIIGGHTKNRAA